MLCPSIRMKKTFEYPPGGSYGDEFPWRNRLLMGATRLQESLEVISIGTASANSAKFRGIRPRMYIEELL